VTRLSLACPSFIAETWPDLCRAVDHYCERLGPQWDAEPVNALTNLAFLVAAWAAWRLRRAHPLAAGQGLLSALIVTTAVVGLGSLLFHTLGTRWAEWGDVLPILAFMLLYLWYVLKHLFPWPRPRRLAAVVLFAAVTVAIEAFVPPAFLWGGALYLPALGVLTIIAGALFARGSPGGGTLLAGALVLVLSFTARTLDAVVCPAFPLGTHFLWHLMNAVLLYLLVRAAILAAESGPPGEAA
jgi:hypothetical protein